MNPFTPTAEDREKAREAVRASREVWEDPGFIWPDREEYHAHHNMLWRRLQSGDLVLPTFGHRAFENAEFRRHFMSKAVIVAANLLSRGLRGAAAEAHLEETAPHILRGYEGKAALAMIGD